MDEMSGKTQEELIDELVDLIVESQRLVVFTGAGISTESGLPDFRGPDGLWTKVDPDDFTYQKFISDPEARKRLWQMQKTVGLAWSDVQPNPAHYAVAELEKLRKLDCVITQNVDGLHQKAGNSEDRVIQLHGNMQWAICLSCHRRFPMKEVLQRIKEGAEVPDCLYCHGILKPAAVFFGEALPQETLMEATRRSENCDLFIVIGSTLIVYPAAYMPMYAKDAGAKLAIINLSPTPLDQYAAVLIQGKAGKVMSKVMEKLRNKISP